MNQLLGRVVWDPRGALTFARATLDIRVVIK